MTWPQRFVLGNTQIRVYAPLISYMCRIRTTAVYAILLSQSWVRFFCVACTGPSSQGGGGVHNDCGATDPAHTNFPIGTNEPSWRKWVARRL